MAASQLTARQRCRADSSRLNAIAIPAAREPLQDPSGPPQHIRRGWGGTQTKGADFKLPDLQGLRAPRFSSPSHPRSRFPSRRSRVRDPSSAPRSPATSGTSPPSVIWVPYGSRARGSVGFSARRGTALGSALEAASTPGEALRVAGILSLPKGVRTGSGSGSRCASREVGGRGLRGRRSQGVGAGRRAPRVRGPRLHRLGQGPAPARGRSWPPTWPPATAQSSTKALLEATTSPPSRTSDRVACSSGSSTSSNTTVWPTVRSSTTSSTELSADRPSQTSRRPGGLPSSSPPTSLATRCWSCPRTSASTSIREEPLAIDPGSTLIADAVRMSMSIPFFFTLITSSTPRVRTGLHHRRRRRGVQFPGVDLRRRPGRPAAHLRLRLVGAGRRRRLRADLRHLGWVVRTAVDLLQTASDAFDTEFASHSRRCAPVRSTRMASGPPTSRSRRNRADARGPGSAGRPRVPERL